MMTGGWTTPAAEFGPREYVRLPALALPKVKGNDCVLPATMEKSRWSGESIRPLASTGVRTVRFLGLAENCGAATFMKIGLLRMGLPTMGAVMTGAARADVDAMATETARAERRRDMMEDSGWLTG
jgi:hypothetical protein